MKPDRKAVFAWALYDWANSAFATTVMAGFFPLFFKQYWSAGTDADGSTWQLGAANSIGGLVVALSRARARSRSPTAAAARSASCSASRARRGHDRGLHFVGKGDWLTAALLYAIATVGFAGGMVFYDSLIVSVAPRDDSDRASALGYSLGYLGGGLLFALNATWRCEPAAFGLADTAEGVRLSFLLVALWWAVSRCRCFATCASRAARARALAASVREGVSAARATPCAASRLRPVMLFLIGYWLYIDGVDTVIRMAVDYGLSLGLDSGDLIMALLITQFVGFPAALVFGRLGGAIRIQARDPARLGVYVGITIWGYFMDSEREFYGLAVAVGLVQGGVQALEPLALQPADPARRGRRVLRVLQHARQVRGDHRADADGPSPLPPAARGSILVVVVLSRCGWTDAAARGRGGRSPRRAGIRRAVGKRAAAPAATLLTNGSGRPEDLSLGTPSRRSRRPSRKKLPRYRSRMQAPPFPPSLRRPSRDRTERC